MSNDLIRCPFHLQRLGREDGAEPAHWSCNCDLEQGVFFCHGCGARGALRYHPELIALAEQVHGTISRSYARPEFTIPLLAGVPKEYLLSRGFTVEILRTFEVGGDSDRVYVPVKLRDGRVVGIIFRFISGEARYIYSSGFSKRNHVFGSYQFLPDNDTVCVVEGALDCIRMHQLEIRNTVALLGDQPTSGQLDLLKQLGYTIVIAFDNDEPGEIATLKVGSLLLHRGHSVFVLKYEGKDPGELSSTKSFELQPYLSFSLTHSERVLV